MATKTITLTGAEVAVTGLDGAHAHIRNDSTDTIYAAKTAGITAGADGVASIPAGQADTLRGISGAVYLLGTGSALIQSDDYVESPFKASTASGGSVVDDVARAAVSTHAGNADIHVTAAEKTSWNGKAELSDIPTELPANGGNADTLEGKNSTDFVQNYKSYISEGSIKDFLLTANSGYAFVSPDVTDMPIDNHSWWFLRIERPEGSHIVAYAAGIGNSSEYRIIYNATSGNWSSWFNIADFGNAATLGTRPASDFVLKTDYDALAARVAALEGGTT